MLLSESVSCFAVWAFPPHESQSEEEADSVSFTAVQRWICHGAHQRPAHARPTSAGERHRLHPVQRSVGEASTCESFKQTNRLQ